MEPVEHRIPGAPDESPVARSTGLRRAYRKAPTSQIHLKSSFEDVAEHVRPDGGRDFWCVAAPIRGLGRRPVRHGLALVISVLG
jgi:hypothetical protein